MRFVTRVDSAVDGQITTLTEGFPTYFAGIRLLACVSPHVDGQRSPLSETPPTRFTRIRLLTRVDSVVINHLVLVLEGFPTKAAR